MMNFLLNTPVISTQRGDFFRPGESGRYNGVLALNIRDRGISGFGSSRLKVDKVAAFLVTILACNKNLERAGAFFPGGTSPGQVGS
jgi:hypothetical protein